MNAGYEIREIPLSIKASRLRIADMLEENGLRLDPLDRFLGIFDCDDNLVGGGGLQGNTIKCIALNDDVRSCGLSSPLITELRALALERHSIAFVFTKPENRRMFESLSFKTIAEAPNAVMLESSPRGIAETAARYAQLQRDGLNGAIVMNCNPFTAGHEYLISRAAKEVDNLYVIVVSEDASEFSYAERLEMVREGCRGFRNVIVVEGSEYAISQNTFPTYFLKELTDATPTQISLDIDIFGRHIAPALGVTVRFFGSEPDDSLTAEYNRLMTRLLPDYGIKPVEITRLSLDGAVVSASAIRKAIADGCIGKHLSTLPLSSLPYVIAHAAADALRKELDTTPKPGLIDRIDSGAHTDMDYTMMQRSIDLLTPAFARIAKSVVTSRNADPDALRKIGLEAEKEMFEATGGVNTHKGALFTLGLTIAAAVQANISAGLLHPESISLLTGAIASAMATPQNTHGADATQRFGIKGAMQSAREGFRDIADTFLPFYRENGKDRVKTLLRIMAEIDDTNVYHRAGKEGADYVKKVAAEALDADCDEQTLLQLNRDFIDRNISPGGAADMLAMTILIDSLTTTK